MRPLAAESSIGFDAPAAAAAHTAPPSQSPMHHSAPPHVSLVDPRRGLTSAELPELRFLREFHALQLAHASDHAGLDVPGAAGRLTRPSAESRYVVPTTLTGLLASPLQRRASNVSSHHGRADQAPTPSPSVGRDSAITDLERSGQVSPLSPTSGAPKACKAGRQARPRAEPPWLTMVARFNQNVGPAGPAPVPVPAPIPVLSASPVLRVQPHSHRSHRCMPSPRSFIADRW
jgi:hypothetical protein